MFHQKGDRYKITEFYRGATIFDPRIAKTMTQIEANTLIDRMSCYPILMAGDEDNTLIDQLKEGFMLYRKRAMFVGANFDNDCHGKVINEAILSWHYKHYLLHCDDDQSKDNNKKKFVCCGTTKFKECNCQKNCKAWFDAACYVALVMPSSGAAERVFSLLKNLFTEQQLHSLSDLVTHSLFIASNKRSI